MSETNSTHVGGDAAMDVPPSDLTPHVGIGLEASTLSGEEALRKAGELAIEVASLREDREIQEETIAGLNDKNLRLTKLVSVLLILNGGPRPSEAEPTAAKPSTPPPAENSSGSNKPEFSQETKEDIATFMMYMLDKPDFSVRDDANTGGIVRRDLGMNIRRWQKMFTPLKKAELVEIEKETEAHKDYKRITVDVGRLVELADSPEKLPSFITPEMVEKAHRQRPAELAGNNATAHTDEVKPEAAGLPHVPSHEIDDTDWHEESHRVAPFNLSASTERPPATPPSAPRPAARRASTQVRARSVVPAQKNRIPTIPPDDGPDTIESGHGTKIRQEQRAEMEAQEARIRSFRVAASLGTTETTEKFPSSAEMFQILAHRIRLSTDETEETIQFMKESGLANLSGDEEGVHLSLTKQCVALRDQLLARIAARAQQ